MLACPSFWDKLIFQIFQSSVGQVVRWSGKYYMGFVENLILFVTVQNCENLFTFDKVITDYVMSSLFMDHSVYANPNPNTSRKHTPWVAKNNISLSLANEDEKFMPSRDSISIHSENSDNGPTPTLFLAATANLYSLFCMIRLLIMHLALSPVTLHFALCSDTANDFTSTTHLLTYLQ